MAYASGGQLTLQGVVSTLDAVDTTAKQPIGLEVPDNAGNVYKYMQGVASVAAGDWCVFGADGTVARSLNTPLAGPMGVAMAAIVANTYGWFQIVGKVSTAGNGQTQANIASAITSGTPLFLTSTAGRLNGTAAAGSAVLGAWAASTAASNLGDAVISRPFAPGFTLASA